MIEGQVKSVNKLLEYGIGIAILGICVYVLWGKITQVEMKADQCQKTNIEILINQVDKSTDAMREQTEVSKEILTFIRPMPKYRRL